MYADPAQQLITTADSGFAVDDLDDIYDLCEVRTC